MDALRRAEEAKRKAGAPPPRASAAVADELRLDPLEAPPKAEGKQEKLFPSLAEQLASVEADLATGSAATSPRRRAAASELQRQAADSAQAGERSAARNLFAVKQAPQSRTSLWLFLGLVGVATMAIGGYVWWQLQSISGGMLAGPATMEPMGRPALPPTLPTAPPASAPPPSLPAADDAPGTPFRPPAGALEPLPSATPAPSRMAEPASSARRAARDPAGSPRAAAPGVFQRSSDRRQQGQTLNDAYEAWLADRLDDARRGYEQVLRSDPRNADALLGLAAIAARQGQLERAHALYLQVLDSDPNEATAQAALINLRGQSAAAQSESRLKTLIGKQPDSSALYFALGNLYAGQERWSEAQEAYFQAYALEPGNADHIFNVAVSLDHLRQQKLAAQYYGMALSAAETSPSAFDQGAARKRVLELQQ